MFTTKELTSKAEILKKSSANEALKLIRPHMNLALGTGSTVKFFIEGLARLIKEDGLQIQCCSSSQATNNIAKENNITIIDPKHLKSIDLMVDGADEITKNFAAIKGGGGALWMEKILCQQAKKTIIIIDNSKLVKTLGAFPLPIEVHPMAEHFFVNDIPNFLFNLLGHKPICQVRTKNNHKFLTDNGNIIIDVKCKIIINPKLLHKSLISLPYIIETGIFTDIIENIIIASKYGIDIIKNSYPQKQPN